MSVSQTIREAYRITRRLSEGAHAAPLIHASRGLTSAAETGRLTDIVYGVQRHRSLCDWIIASCSTRPLKRVQPAVLDILRIAVYQVRKTSRPDYAVVDEAVGLASEVVSRRAAAFVNAVLRRIVERDGEIAPEDPATLYSHPEWLVRRWVERFGEETALTILRAGGGVPPATLTVNTERIPVEEMTGMLKDHGIAARPHDCVPGSLVVTGGSAARLRGSLAPLVYRQDPWSLALGRLAGSYRGRRVVDLCAAPGGKSIGCRLAGRPDIHAAGDRTPGRVATIRTILLRLGMGDIRCALWDATQAPLRGGSFDVVILDAPCSSTGTFGKNPEARWRLREEDIASFSGRQWKLLEGAAGLVRSGGILLYSTCSLEYEECGIHRDRIPKDVLFKDFEVIHTTPVSYINKYIDNRGVFTILPSLQSSGYSGFLLKRS